MDPVQLEISTRLAFALAGAAGGGIRWWSARSTWRQGLGHMLAGAIAGTFFNGLVFAAIKPLADFSGLAPFDAQLLGAHLAGVLGVQLYAVPTDFLKQWIRIKTEEAKKP